MSTHNICFRGEIRKICGYPLLSVAMVKGDMLMVSISHTFVQRITSKLLNGFCF